MMHNPINIRFIVNIEVRFVGYLYIFGSDKYTEMERIEIFYNF